MLDEVESGGRKARGKTSAWSSIWRVLLQSFTLTFLAEWGDRSQLTTIILAAREVCTKQSNLFITHNIYTYLFIIYLQNQIQHKN